MVQHRGLIGHYSVTGAGLPVVLLHAGASSGAQWKKLEPFLGDRCRIITPDLIGFGQTTSWPGPDELTLDAQAGLVAAVLKASGVDSAHVVGHSYGGATAIRLALQEPERVGSLTLIEPQVAPILLQAGEGTLWEDYRSFAQRFVALVRQGDDEVAVTTFIDRWNGPGSWERLSDKSRAQFVAGAKSVADGYASLLSNPTSLDDCRSISAPTLIICGADTTASERRISEILRDTIPNSRYAVIPGAGHMSPLTHPNEVATLLLEHLSGLT